MRLAFWRPKPAVKALALEDRLRASQERGRLAERSRWKVRMMVLVAELRRRGHSPAADDLESAVEELTGKGR